jgi:hypothetical protein
MRRQVFGARLLYTRGAIIQASQVLALTPQAAIVVNVNKGIIKQAQ